MRTNIKRFIAVLTVVGMMLGFAVPVAADPIPTPVSVPPLSLILEPGQVVSVDGDYLFRNDVLIYPGEYTVFEVGIRDNANYLEAFMWVRDISTPGSTNINLAESMIFTVQRINAAGEVIGANVYSDYLFDFSETRYVLDFANTTDRYRFTLYYEPSFEGEGDERTWVKQNEQMSHVAEFEIRFEMTPQPTTGGPFIQTTTEPQAPSVPPEEEVILPIATTASPETTASAEIPTTAAATETPEIIPEPTAATDDTPEPTGATITELFEEGELIVIPEPEVPLATAELSDDTPIGGHEAEPQEEPEEEFEEVEDEEIPLAGAEFIDRIPRTGENTNPLAYLITGLTVALAGFAMMIAARKKAKA